MASNDFQCRNRIGGLSLLIWLHTPDRFCGQQISRQQQLHAAIRIVRRLVSDESTGHDNGFGYQPW